MTSHAEARELARAALAAVFPGAPPSDGEIAALAGIGFLESGYGDGWKGAGRGSYNMGAVQAGKSWTGATFAYTDTHPNADGSSTPYRIAFRAYPTAQAGWIDLARVAFAGRRTRVREAARRNDLLGVSTELRATGYYEGFGKTQIERIANHCKALTRAVNAAGVVTRPRPLPTTSIPETLRRGAQGEAVRLLQRELGGVAVDGEFGTYTEAAVRTFQGCRGLAVDGVVGPVTWTALLRDARSL